MASAAKDAGSSKDDKTDSPRRVKKKKDKKDKLSWPAIRVPGVPKIFHAKKEGSGDKSKKDEKDESNNKSGARIQFSQSEGLQAKAIKPSPLLRPRSIHGLNANLIIHEGAQGETIVIENNPENRVKPQFGMNPTELAEHYPEEPIPAIIIDCVEILKNDIMKEGVFRIPGRMSNIIEMKISFEQGNGLNCKEPDTYAIAGLLAQFFRELPEPLLMYSLYFKWIEAVKLEEEQIKHRLLELIKELPTPNYNILKYFTAFLTLVGKHSGANRMGPRNLALVFGASLLNPPSIEQYDLENIKLQCLVIEYLIRYYSFIFEGIDDDGGAPGNKVSQAKQLATIPAGPAKPAASPTVPEDKKKTRFIKRAPFFSSSSSQQSSLSQLTVALDIDHLRKKKKKSQSGENPDESDSPHGEGASHESEESSECSDES